MKITEIESISAFDWSPDDVEGEAGNIKKGLKKRANTKGAFGSYKLVPVIGLPDGFYLAYKKEKEWARKDRFIVTLIDARNSMDQPEVVTYLWFNPETVYFGEPNFSSMSGLKVRLLGTTEKYKGQGFAPAVYKMLVNHGQILFSDTSQTPDGTKLWSKLVLSNDMVAFGLDIEENSTLGLNFAMGPITPQNFKGIKDDVFGRYTNQFVLIPKNDTQTIKLLTDKSQEYWK
jgi:hypothetical protein